MPRRRETDSTTQATALPGRLPGPHETCLVLIYGDPRIGQRFVLGGETVIGRDPTNAVSVDSSDVSRRHAQLTPKDGAWIVRDLDSLNGTEVNGDRLEGERVLANGDLVKTGGVVFKYLHGGDVEAGFHEEIYRLTIRDGLTGAYNRRFLTDTLAREVARAHRHASPLWLAMLDVDHFKAVNDTHGHLVGDRVLAAVAHEAAARLRPEQVLARYGGEELAIVLPELSSDQVRILGERIREAVAAHGVSVNAGPAVKVTISIGIASLRPGMNGDQLIVAADAELYRAKATGRNRVMVAGDTSPAPIPRPPDGGTT